MHPAELTALATEARWHTVASVIVLPLLLLGFAGLAVLAFGALEMGLVTAQRRPQLAPHMQRAVRRSVRLRTA